MSPTIITLPLKLLVGITIRISNANAAQEIPKLWQQFYQTDVAQRIPHKKSADIIALYCDYASDFTGLYSLIIGCEVTSTDDTPDDMIIKEIPACTYAVFKAKGEFPTQVVKTWQTIWQSSLNRTYTGDFELYAPDFDPVKNPEVNIYIAVKK